MSNTLSTNDIAPQLIRYYEQCRLEPYLDAKGVATIGWGNTVYIDNSRVAMDDQPLTQSEADKLFDFWLNSFSTKVAAHVVGAKPNELAAFISLAYNIGLANFLHSSALRVYLAGSKTGAANDIEMWNKAGNTVLKGLQRRRRAEKLVFLGATVSLATAQAEKDFP